VGNGGGGPPSPNYSCSVIVSSEDGNDYKLVISAPDDGQVEIDDVLVVFTGQGGSELGSYDLDVDQTVTAGQSITVENSLPYISGQDIGAATGCTASTGDGDQ
jgi:hypothetical protein